MLDLAELVFGDVVFSLCVAGEEQAGLAGVPLELVFGALQFDAHILELAGRQSPVRWFIFQRASMLGSMYSLVRVLAKSAANRGSGESDGDLDDAGLTGGA